MALLVCYSEDPPHDHTKEKAIYLDQAFYAGIVDLCIAPESGYTILRDIAALRYKSPTMSIEGDRISKLDGELKCLMDGGEVHEQIQELRKVCTTALERGSALTVSGDMYPELT